MPINDTTELWLPVVGYEGFYEVSNLGRVRSTRSGHGTYVGRIIKPWVNGRGYVCTRLHVNNSLHQFRVHQLVVTAFLRPKMGKEEVNHIDGNKLNNVIENLEYTSRGGNVAHAYRTGLRPRTRAKHPLNH